MALWHASFNSDNISIIKSTLKNIINNPETINSYFNDYFFEFLNELNKSLNKEPNKNISIIDKIRDKKYDFTPIELAELKIAIGNTYFKGFLEYAVNKKIFTETKITNELFININNRGKAKANLLFWDDPNERKIPVISQIVGHKAVCDTIGKYIYIDKTTFDIDVVRSRYMYNDGPDITTVSTVFFDKTKDFRESLCLHTDTGVYICDDSVILEGNVCIKEYDYIAQQEESGHLSRSPTRMVLSYKNTCKCSEKLDGMKQKSEDLVNALSDVPRDCQKINL